MTTASAAASAATATLDRPIARPIFDRWPPWGLLAGGLLLTLMTGPRWGIELFGWLAPVPYLVYARGARGGMAWIWLFETLFVGHCLQFAAIATPSVPMAAVLGFGPLLAILRFGAVGIAELARRRIGESAGIVAFVSSTVMLDCLAYGALELDAWMGTANSQVDALSMLQVSSIAGFSALGALMARTAATRGVNRSVDPAAQVRARLAAMVSEQELPGAQYVAVQADRILLDAHVGVADTATGQPMEGATLQMTYSVTKAVTAIAVMQLVDAGKIELDAPLSRYWPAHPYGTGVTIRSLLAHTSGVPNPLPLDWFVVEGERLDRDASLRRILAKHDERSAEVGQAYGYSNIAYWLLEKSIEGASREDYAAYVQRHVFEPLEVAGGATFDLPPQRSTATGHSRRFSPMNLILYAMTPSRYWASPHQQWSRAARVQPLGRGYGGLYASASVLAKVLQDLLRPRPTLLSPRARDQMLAEQHTRDGSPTSATLGWAVGELDGVRYFGKQGGGLGFHGNVRLYPQLGLATVLLANRTEISPGPIDARSDQLDAAFVTELISGR